MAVQSVSTAAAVLQEDYEPRARAQLNSSTVLADRLKRKRRGFEGNNLIMAAKKSRGWGHPTGDTEILPRICSAGYEQLKFDIVKTGQRMGLTREAIERTKNSPSGAFVDLLETEMENVVEFMEQLQNRQFHEDANGRLAQVATAITTETVVVQVDSTRHIPDGAPVYIADADGTGATSGYTATISLVDSGTQVTLAAVASGVTTDDYFYYRGGDDAAIRIKDMFGLINITDTTDPTKADYGSLNRATNSWWQGNVLGNSGTDRPISVRLMKNALDLTWRRGGDTSLIVCSDAIMLEYGDQLAADRRFQASEMTLDGGWKGLSVAGVPMVADKDCRPKKVHFLDERHIFLAILADWQFEDMDGNVLRMIADYHEFEAYYFTMRQLVCDRCNVQTRLDDIEEPSPTWNQ